MDKFEKRRLEKENLFKDIEYGNLPIEAKHEIFELAWDMGHSSGLYEVEAYYQELTEFIEGKILPILKQKGVLK